ncbi:MAG TPA: betaine--homocysteine S-methyltransferase [Gammaproteobacteria bacterium]|nr:betaine--homocysteine S-methyltransferase [Gammaproteobacteria bacterium]
MSNLLAQLLQQRPFVLADGATGTNLFAMGLPTGGAPELWNVEAPHKVAELHRSFIDAGSDLVLTNSFGGNRCRLKLHDAENRVGELNRAAGEIARRSVDSCGHPVVVAGSMGPTGELFSPLGPLSHDEGAEIFAGQARALAAGGVDLLWIETMSSKEELEAALTGGRSTGLPLVCTLSFDTNGRTMMGLSPAELAKMCREATEPPLAFGANCGVGAPDLLAGLLSIDEDALSDAVVVAKANCGIPVFEDGEICYTGTPGLMADYARLAFDAGARIIGGCCGTTPAHVAAMRAALDTHTRGGRPTLEQVESRLGEISDGAKALKVLDALAYEKPTRRRGRRKRRG